MVKVGVLKSALKRHIEEQKGQKVKNSRAKKLQIAENSTNQDRDNAEAPQLVHVEAEKDFEDNSSENDEEVESEGEEMALSDADSLILNANDDVDIVPYQRMTINNRSALAQKYKSICRPYSSLKFSDHQVVISSEAVNIKDVNDDLSRELAFYKQALEAAQNGKKLFVNEGVPFTRPTDYFAEMLKTDQHMDKVKNKLVEDATAKKASETARKQRDLKKFGKQVQMAKLQEREKSKKDTLDKIKTLKRKRGGEDLTTNDDFDVALDTASKKEEKKRPKVSRKKRDEKFGFGGKKRYSKSNDAKSSGDIDGFSVKKMKGTGPKKAGGVKKRLGKSRRAKN
ncbi:putative rRNA-processing protein ebp2 [Neolecta irregularis DAH-3]|uniref:Putative rRNA-processing protein ebp2 n=1 Tax=Neolecta irregularis (strain DAH-3) TaxID=1198029 RepID=A0A1U7LQP5_NEOID|nr:putative rRNA-processing protein ebp2 [Neolecta irregularis DAH-3]|eukprot:OLL24903.1 putative rRNA-processing protein ebp2 [Neolecta irregularis DAH-3]